MVLFFSKVSSCFFQGWEFRYVRLSVTHVTACLSLMCSLANHSCDWHMWFLQATKVDEWAKGQLLRPLNSWLGVPIIMSVRLFKLLQHTSLAGVFLKSENAELQHLKSGNRLKKNLAETVSKMRKYRNAEFILKVDIVCHEKSKSNFTSFLLRHPCLNNHNNSRWSHFTISRFYTILTSSLNSFCRTASFRRSSNTPCVVAHRTDSAKDRPTWPVSTADRLHLSVSAVSRRETGSTWRKWLVPAAERRRLPLRATVRETRKTHIKATHMHSLWTDRTVAILVTRNPTCNPILPF